MIIERILQGFPHLDFRQSWNLKLTTAIALESLGKRSINDDIEVILGLDLAVRLENDRFRAKTSALQSMKSRVRR